MKPQLILAMSAICILSTGCTLSQNLLRTSVVQPIQYSDFWDVKLERHRFRKLALKELERARVIARAETDNYVTAPFSVDEERGFVAGFIDHLIYGGTGNPPPLPPRRYWWSGCESLHGCSAIQDWFRGFEHGAAVAEASGYRNCVTVQLSEPPLVSTLPVYPGQLPNSDATQEFIEASGEPTMAKEPADRPLGSETESDLDENQVDPFPEQSDPFPEQLRPPVVNPRPEELPAPGVELIDPPVPDPLGTRDLRGVDELSTGSAIFHEGNLGSRTGVTIGLPIADRPEHPLHPKAPWYTEPLEAAAIPISRESSEQNATKTPERLPRPTPSPPILPTQTNALEQPPVTVGPMRTYSNYEVGFEHPLDSDESPIYPEVARSDSFSLPFVPSERSPKPARGAKRPGDGTSSLPSRFTSSPADTVTMTQVLELPETSEWSPPGEKLLIPPRPRTPVPPQNALPESDEDGLYRWDESRSIPVIRSSGNRHSGPGTPANASTTRGTAAAKSAINGFLLRRSTIGTGFLILMAIGLRLTRWPVHVDRHRSGARRRPQRYADAVATAPAIATRLTEHHAEQWWCRHLPTDTQHRLRSPRTRLAAASMMLLLCVATGCSSLTNPVLNGIPVRKLPPELLSLPQREALQTVPLTLLRQPQPEEYVLGPGDVVGVYIAGVFPPTLAEQPLTTPPVYFPSQIDPLGAGLPPSLGYPVTIRNDGTLALPLVEPIRLEGLTVEEANERVRDVYVDTGMLQPGRESVMLALMQPRQIRVVVFRQEIGGFASGGRGDIRINSVKQGTGHIVDLRAYENDVLNALAYTGGMPGLDAFDGVYIFRGGQSNVELTQRLQAFSGDEAMPELSTLGVEIDYIPTRWPPGEPLPFQPEDVILREGDVVLLEARVEDLYYTAGLLPAGERVLPRDYDLDVVEAVVQASGTLVNGAFGGNNFNGLLIQKGVGNPNPSALTVIRRSPNGGQIPIRVDLNRALIDPRERILVQPGDVLILQETRHESVARYLNEIFNFNIVVQAFQRGSAQGAAAATQLPSVQ